MSNNKPFYFYMKLATKINQAARIRHKFVDVTVVRKIIKVLLMKIFGSKIDAIMEATFNIKKLIVNKLVSKLRAYEVANAIVQEPKVKDTRFNLVNKISVDDSDDDNLSVDILDQEIAMLSSKIQKID